MRAWLIGWILLAVTLAGCSDGGSEAGEDEFEDFGDVQVDKDRGIIRGIVLDPTITPVVDARVEISGTDVSTQSNENGAFLFTDLEPGPYFLKVSKPGYTTVQSNTQVEAGVEKPAIVRVQIQRIPGAEPSFIPHMHTGTIGCSYKAANYVGGCNVNGVFGEEDSTIFVPVERPPTYYQTEIMWESTQQFGHEMVTIQWACAEGQSCNANSNDHRTCNVRGPSPIVCRVDQEGGGGSSAYQGINGTRLGQDGRGLIVRAYANCSPCVSNLGVGLMIDQTFTEYTHLFFNYKPPEDWLFVESSEVPPP